MGYIIETPNAYKPLTGVRKHVVNHPITIRAWLEKEYPGFVEFKVPTVCVVNGQGVVRGEWDREIGQYDIVNFITLPSGYILVIAAIIVAVIVASVVLVLTLPRPTTPGEQPASDPVFSTKGQQNAIRVGEPIEVCYGRNRIYPSLAARPYFQYIDNDQFQYTLLCIGQGSFDIAEIRIGDTPIANFQEVQYEVIEPGGSLSLFPESVYTSEEAGGQTLFGPNEPEYVSPGWVGPFPTNPSGTVVTKIQVDLNYNKGIYILAEDGRSTDPLTVITSLEYRPINDLGAPTGSGIFSPLLVTGDYTITAQTTTPQRRTLERILPAGRYEVRIRRTSAKDLSNRSGNDVIWEGMRGFASGSINFGNVTLLAAIVRATNNLNERSQLAFNVIATRKIPIRTAGVWGAPVASRSVVWAMVDVFKSYYGGRIDADNFFNWSELEALHTLYEARGDHFDWIFRDPITVWDAARAIARVGRAVPLLTGSLISMKRDGPLEVPVTLFTPDNIVSGSFQWEVKLWDLDEFDSIRVEYTEPATGYNQQTVLATLPGGTTDHPQDIRLPGVQDRNHAYREGLHMRASQKYLRENCTFETGLEGYVPTFGDLVAVRHDLPKWGQSGYVAHAERQTGTDRYHLYVSEPLNWVAGAEHQIILRGRTSEVIGPLTALQTGAANQVDVDIPGVDDFDFLLGGETEPMLFAFGLTGQITKLARVVKIEPQGSENIKVSVVNDAPIIHTFDSLPAPALGTPSVAPVPPDLPNIRFDPVINLVDPVLLIIAVSWPPAFGAQYYIIQTSTDGVNWTPPVTSVRTSIQVQARLGVFWVRVAGVNVGQGAWVETNAVIDPLTVLAESIDWEDNTIWEVRWNQVFNAVQFKVRIYNNMGSLPVEKRAVDLSPSILSYVYDLAAAIADGNVVRKMMVSVNAVFPSIGETDSPVELALENSIPSPAGSLLATTDTVAGDHITYKFQWTVHPEENDLVTVKLWLSPTNGFDPAVTSPAYTYTAPSPGSVGIPLQTFLDVPTTGGAHPAYYWRVGLFDVWGNELSTNITAQQTLPAVP